jgi:succinoglycan biosynthesis protein ExoA
MKISIIIPVKPGGAVAALEALRNLEPGSPDHEIIIAEGRRPSRQRNIAAAAAEGDLLYFLDDDAAAAPDSLKRIAAAFSDVRVVAVGGPSITPSGDTRFQRAIARVLSSTLGGGAIRNRYRRHGGLRDTDDRELILCNLAFRKDIYVEYGGLDERLYPNEENELIDRLLASGGRLLHDPDMYVVRSQRPTLKAFIRQMVTYGRGRAEQSLLTRSLSFKALIPALFAIYIVSLALLPLWWWYFLPLFVYLTAIAVNMLSAAAEESIAVAVRLPVIYTLLHFCYGAGFIAGVLSPRYKAAGGSPEEINLKRVKMLGSDW